MIRLINHVCLLGMMKRVDVFAKVKDTSKYAQDLKGLPNLRNLETSKKTIEKLDKLYKKYKKARDKSGMMHCTLIAEIAENQTMRKGLIGQMKMYQVWLEKIRNP